MQEINLNLRSAGLPTPEKVFSWKGILSNDESYEMPVEIFILYHSGTMTFIIVLWKRRTTFWHVADYFYCKYTFSIITRKTNVWPNGLISCDLTRLWYYLCNPTKERRPMSVHHTEPCMKYATIYELHSFAINIKY